jgi:PKD repeat protein
MKRNLPRLSYSLIFSLFLSVGLVFSSFSITKANEDGDKTKNGKSSFSIKTSDTEDWETGDMSSFEWVTGGTADWFVTDLEQYEGAYSATSGDINDNQNSYLQLTQEVYAEDVISFWYKVSSESNFDYLNFYIDNTLMDSWAGEIPWSYIEYNVSVGTHTFKWEYDKDISISTGGDAGWIDLIHFPPTEVKAIFSASTTDACVDQAIDFADESTGPISSWEWTFEGGEPATSTEQNPSITYSSTGDFDVQLIVSDGIETDTTLIENFINVNDVPPSPGFPSGIALLCQDPFNTTYSTTGTSGATSYNWELNPPEAGEIIGSGTTISIDWENTYIGVVTLKVSGENYCGTGPFSIPLTITIDACTGMNEVDNISQTQIYPNPSNGIFTLKMNLEEQRTIDIRVFNSLNKMVYQANKITAQREFQKDIDLGKYAKGIYYLHVNGDNMNEVKKIVIQK